LNKVCDLGVWYCLQGVRAVRRNCGGRFDFSVSTVLVV
jgi:hypothetical protein